MDQHRGLAAKQLDQRKRRHRHASETLDVAGQRGAVEKLFLPEIVEREFLAVRAERGEHDAERAVHVEAHALEQADFVEHVAARAPFVAEVVELGVGADAAAARVGLAHAAESGVGSRKLRRRRAAGAAEQDTAGDREPCGSHPHTRFQPERSASSRSTSGSGKRHTRLQGGDCMVFTQFRQPQTVDQGHRGRARRRSLPRALRSKPGRS